MSSWVRFLSTNMLEVSIFNSDGRLAIVDTPFGGVLIDLQQQNQIAQLGGGDFTFSRDSEYIAIGASEQTTGGYYDYIKLWDVGREEIVYRSLPTLLEFRIHGMSRPAISPDSRLVAAGHSDSRVYVWNIDHGETRFILEGHARMVNSVDFSPDGRYLASGSADGTVRLWNPEDGRLVRVITGFVDSITGVEFSADSRVLRVNVDKQPDQAYDLTSGQLSAWQEAAATPDPFTSMLLAEGYLEVDIRSRGPCSARSETTWRWRATVCKSGMYPLNNWLSLSTYLYR